MGRFISWIRKTLGIEAEPDLKKQQRDTSRPPVAKSIKATTLKPKPPTDVRIGLDFGTSCSKIVVRAPYIGNGLAWAIPFNEKKKPAGARYLFPTPFVNQGSSNKESIKVSLLERPNDQDVIVNVAKYLANLIGQARNWIESSQSKILRGYELRWGLNLGVPSTGYGDDEIRRTFQKSARLAWEFVECGFPKETHEMNRIMSSIDADDDEGSIQIVAEIVAAAVGYARSAMRKRGLHLLVDVGATTLDVCGFVLSEREGEDCYNLLTTAVKRLGAHELHRERLISMSHDDISGEIQDINLDDPMVIIPDQADIYIANGLSYDDLREIDQQFRNKCVTQIMECLFHLKRKRDPYSPAWEEGLPALISGGGSRMQFYDKVLNEASNRCVNNWNNMRDLSKMRLPVPFQLQNKDINEDMFVRLGTAYGLSFDRFDIGNIRPPQDFDDVHAPIRRKQQSFVSKDQV